MLPLFFAIGIIFAPIGGALIYASAKVQEIIIDYSDCNTTAPACPTMNPIPSGKITSYFKNTTDPADAPTWCKNFTEVGYGVDFVKKVHTPTCHVQFYIPDKLSAPVLLYYQLTNFYQNHRRYVKSFDQDQLKGTYRSNHTIYKSDCDPLKLDGNGKAYYPCGLIANSVFNDSFHSPVLLSTVGTSASNMTYQMTDVGIAWSSDKDLYGKKTNYKMDEVVPPPNWRERYPAYNSSFPFRDLHDDEAFQVWMRTAGLPTFSKLALRNDDDDMTPGRYEVDIYDCESKSW